jgi:hypothetical protein
MSENRTMKPTEIVLRRVEQGMTKSGRGDELDQGTSSVCMEISQRHLFV